MRRAWRGWGWLVSVYLLQAPASCSIPGARMKDLFDGPRIQPWADGDDDECPRLALCLLSASTEETVQAGSVGSRGRKQVCAPPPPKHLLVGRPSGPSVGPESASARGGPHGAAGDGLNLRWEPGRGGAHFRLLCWRTGPSQRSPPVGDGLLTMPELAKGWPRRQPQQPTPALVSPPGLDDGLSAPHNGRASRRHLPHRQFPRSGAPFFFFFLPLPPPLPPLFLLAAVHVGARHQIVFCIPAFVSASLRPRPLLPFRSGSGVGGGGRGVARHGPEVSGDFWGEDEEGHFDAHFEASFLPPFPFPLASRRCPSPTDRPGRRVQIRRLVSASAGLAQRPLRGLHRQLDAPQCRRAGHRLWRQSLCRRLRPRRPVLPAGDAQQEGPVQRRRPERAREPERVAGGGHPGQGQDPQGCLCSLPSPAGRSRPLPGRLADPLPSDR